MDDGAQFGGPTPLRADGQDEDQGQGRFRPDLLSHEAGGSDLHVEACDPARVADGDRERGQGIPLDHWQLFSRVFNGVPDHAWVCVNNLTDVLGPIEEVKKTVKTLRIPYEHTSTCVRTDGLYSSGGPVSLITRGSGVVSVYAHPSSDITTKRSTLLLLRPADAQNLIMLTDLTVRSHLINLMRNVQNKDSKRMK